MSTVFDLLDEVRKRPGLFVGGDERHRVQQLQDLELLLFGYAMALRYHSIQEPVTDFGREFAEYLNRTRDWSTSCGPTAAVIDATKNEQEAWELFWRLVDEFRTAMLSQSE
jgi:hypothetical protein